MKYQSVCNNAPVTWFDLLPSWIIIFVTSLLYPTAGQRPPLQQATSVNPRPVPASLGDRRKDLRAIFCEVCLIFTFFLFLIGFVYRTIALIIYLTAL